MHLNFHNHRHLECHITATPPPHPTTIHTIQHAIYHDLSLAVNAYQVVVFGTKVS